MSRQYNEKMENRFELYGDEYELVYPTNLEELVEAIRIRDLLQQGIDSHEPDSGHPYYHLHRTQTEWIDDFVVNLGEFDNSFLMKNIAFLTKKNGIGIGNLEKILGISAGYISRTAKGTSGKKMSIDNVWRIARLFGVDLRSLLECDLKISNTNTELLIRFLEKLSRQTEANEIIWKNCGGAICNLDERLAAFPYFVEEEDALVYKVPHLNPDKRFIIVDDIFSCKDIDPQREFIMVAYTMEGRENFYEVDFYFLSADANSPEQYRLEKAFFSADDKFQVLDTYASNLMHNVQTQEMDATLTPTVRNLITDYLN